MSMPTPEELQVAWQELQDIHSEYLALHKVKIPTVTHYAKSQKAIWLSVLWHYREREVPKDEVSAIVRREMPTAAADQQVRHLKRDGWNIGRSPGRHKLDPYKPSQEFINANAAKSRTLQSADFDAIKTRHGHRCATCGAKDGLPHPLYGAERVKLQRGHRDPHEAGNNPGNIIPQCQFCNRAYKGDFTFDEKGRIHAVAGIGPVRRASDHVKSQIWKFLNKNFGNRH